MTDQEFAAYIDQLYVATNTTRLPIVAQHWTPEMLVEMYVSSTIDLDWDHGIPDEVLDDSVLIYRDDNEPPPLTPAQQTRLEQAIAEAKAAYWRGKLAERQS